MLNRRPAPPADAPALGPELAEALARLILCGGMVLIASRASASGGREARRLAVQGIYTAAAELAALGVDVRHLLPPEDVLRKLVAAAEPERNKTHDGKEFVNHSYVHPGLLRYGVVLLIQYGPGTKVNENFIQPAIGAAANVIELHRPVLVYVNQARSWGRSGPGLAQVFWQLRRTGDELGEPIFVGDKRRGLRPFTLQVEEEMSRDAYRAEQEALDTEERIELAVAHRAVGGPVEGAFEVLCAGPLPPPMASCHMRGTAQRPEFRAAFLDTPGARPAANLVLHGAPEVYEADTPAKRASVAAKGRHRGTYHRKGRSAGAARRAVDQLALVRWFYEHYLVGEWTTLATAQYLASHGYSTEGLRHENGPRAMAGVRRSKRLRSRDARHICDSIWKHHQFHLSGNLVVKVRGGAPITYEITTPDGRPIATSDQVERIERARQLLSSTRPRTSVCVLTGVEVIHNGLPCTLTPEHRGGNPLCWHFQRVEGYTRGGRNPKRRHPRRRRPPAVPIPHWVLVAAIYRAALEADLVPVLPDKLGLQRTQLSDELALATGEWEEAKRTAEAAWAHVDNPGHDKDGKSLRRARTAAHAADKTVAEASTKVKIAKGALEAFGKRTHAEILAVNTFLDFAEAIRNPFDARLRTTLRYSIIGFTATSTRTRMVSDLRHGRVDFSFELRMVDADGQLWALPVRGRYDRGGALGIGPRVYEALAAMHQGTPACDSFGKDYPQWIPHLKAALTGDPHAPCVIVSVRDPWLLQLGMNLLYPLLPEPDWDAVGPAPLTPARMPRLVGSALRPLQRARRAREFGETPAFLHRLAVLYNRTGLRTARWLPPSAPRLAGAIEAAAAGCLRVCDLPGCRTTREGSAIFEVDDAVVRLAPCPMCGSRNRALYQLYEPVGLICQDCRCDEAGNSWPVEYDRYRMRTDWVGSRHARAPLAGAA